MRGPVDANVVEAALRARFGAVYRLDFYDLPAMEAIVVRAAKMLAVPAEPEGIREIARRARGTPRVALRLLKRVRDFAQVRAEGRITVEVARAGLDLMEVDELGLDTLVLDDRGRPRDPYGGDPPRIRQDAATQSPRFSRPHRPARLRFPPDAHEADRHEPAAPAAHPRF